MVWRIGVKEGRSCMPITEVVLKKIADDTGISADDLTVAGLFAFLREKRNKIMMERLDILARYGLDSSKAMETKIKESSIPEHPAWEDLILVENLEATLALIDEDIQAIQKPS